MFAENRTQIIQSFKNLLRYCEGEDFMGWDPYDGLNSRLFQFIPFLNRNRFCRLAWIQAFKRNPINFRRFAGVDKGYNPKALGLFLSAYCMLYQIKNDDDLKKQISFLATKLLELKSKGWSGACWGYNFDWQARAFYQPRYTPTIVATTYIGYALLDAFEILGDEELLDEAVSIKEFIKKDLNRTEGENGAFAFSYSPLDKTQIFNASLLGSRMLARLFFYTGEMENIELARKSVLYCVKHQKNDGAWSYGTLPYHQWIDNFHTGFILESLHEYQKYSGDTSFYQNIQLGLKYYLNTFFTEEGISKYYNNSIYPIDIHAPAQLVITLSRLNKFNENYDLVVQVLLWTIKHMQDPKGYFYYQIKKRFSSKIPYMRWAQAWMFNAMCFYMWETKRLNSFSFEFQTAGNGHSRH